MSRISARIPNELHKKIKKEAENTEKNQSQIIREKLREGFETKNGGNEKLRKRMNELESTVKDLKSRLDDQNDETKEVSESNLENPSLDMTDKKIIQYVSQGSYSLSELSDLVGVSQNTVYRRINKLKEKNVLKEGYMAIPNYKKIGLSFVLTGMNVKPEDKEKAIKLLKEKNQVKFLWETLGDHDIVADLLCSGSEKVEDIRKLRKELEEEGIEIRDFDVSESSTSEKIDLKPTF